MDKSYYPDLDSQKPEEPHIEREVENDKTGMIRKYLRLADKLLKPKAPAKSDAA